MHDRCPNCGQRRPYLMAQNAPQAALPTQLICWVIITAIVLVAAVR